MPKFKWVMVLSDGQTFSELDGCSIIAVPDDIDEYDVDDFIRSADGYYCFDSVPEIDSNNGFTKDEVGL